MIGHSWSEYVFIRLSIFALRSIAPLSILYSCFSLYYGRLLYSRWLGAYAAAEAAFYLLVFIPRTRFLQKVSFSDICCLLHSQREGPFRSVSPMLFVLASIRMHRFWFS